MVSITVFFSLFFISTILYAASCRLDITPSYLTLQADSGTKYSALCSCVDTPDGDVQFTWFRHGSLLVNTNRVQLEFGNPGRIFFHRLLVEDEGEYTCVLTKSDGSSTNSSLLVYVSPQIMDNEDSIQLSIGTGSTIELACPVKSLDQHSTLSIEWSLPNGVQLSPDNQKSGRFYFLSENEQLLFTQAEVKDTGSYGCHASNLAGSVVFVWKINVKEFVTKTVDRSLTTTSPISRITESITGLPTPFTENSSSVSEKETEFSLLSNPIYLTLIIVALLFTCTLILITIIISITCFCGVCYRNKLVSEEACTSSLHRTPPPTKSTYYTQVRDYASKSGYFRQHTPSPAPSLLSLAPHGSRRMNGQLTCCSTDTGLDSPVGHSQNCLAPVPTKHETYHIRCPSDQVDYRYVSTSQSHTPCARCCPSVTMSEPRMYTYSPRPIQKCAAKKHSLPDRIDEPHGPHPLTMVQSCDTPYPNISVQQVDV